MSRSDGLFPNYVKLDIDSDKWPDNYWDRSYECSVCGVCWPRAHLFDPSPCCGKPCIKSDSSPMMRWPDAVSALIHSRFDHFYEEFNEGEDDEDLELSWEELEEFIDIASKDPFTRM